MAVLLLSPASAASDIPTDETSFRAEDRWISIGDSITQNGLYTRYIQYFHLTREPKVQLSPIDAGIAGDTLSGVIRRFDWDIAPTRPTVATGMLGMNDVGRSNYSAEPASTDLLERRQVSLTHFEQNLRTLVPRLREIGTRVVVLSPTPYDDTAVLTSTSHTGCNAALSEIARIGRTVAAETQSGFIDLHTPLTELNHHQQSIDPSSTIIGGDRVHPGAPGHLATAFYLLKAQGVRREVATVHLDATRSTVSHVENCHITGLAISPDTITFTYSANSLPFHVPGDARSALKWIPFHAELNREELQITGLARGTWSLSINDQPVASLSDTDLENGVNLAEHDTPQLTQSKSVLALLEKRWEMTARLRLIAAVEHQHAQDLTVPPTVDLLEPALTAWEEKLSAEPPNHWQRKHPAQYREWKPAQATIQTQADDHLRQARTVAAPQARRITLTRTPAQVR